MIFFGAIPLVIGVVLVVVAPAASARMSPRGAAVGLTALSLLVAAATGAMLVLLAVFGVAEMFPGMAPADWSTRTLSTHAPLPGVAGLAAAALVVVLAANAIRHALAVVRELRAAHRAASGLPSYGGLAVADDEAAFAYAVPGRPGRIVVSSGLLRTLTGEQRRALLAHERAHLEHHHVAYAQLTRLAAAANPLLRPVARVVDVALERWADADAADAVGDNRVVAHAIAAAGLHRRTVPARAQGRCGNAVVQRVQLLLEPPVVQRRWQLLLAVIAVACCVGAGAATLDAHTLIEAAEGLGR